LLFFVCSLFLISCFSFERKGERQCKSQHAIEKPSVHPFPKLYLRWLHLVFSLYLISCSPLDRK
jgi:hypothetical protein